jgi:bifunctional DNA-binding transcriptional regulator/antitoxin component of YhaV-PrlF toxin-antitoxin module
MAKVGTKYQVVIGRDARRRLGIGPDWAAIETVVGDRLELRFLPPEHDRSLAGGFGGTLGPAPRNRLGRRGAAWEAHVEEGWGS